MWDIQKRPGLQDSEPGRLDLRGQGRVWPVSAAQHWGRRLQTGSWPEAGADTRRPPEAAAVAVEAEQLGSDSEQSWRTQRTGQRPALSSQRRRQWAGNIECNG